MQPDTTGLTVAPMFTEDEAWVLRLDGQQRLGYLAASDEWTRDAGVPLHDDEQDAAHALYHAGWLGDSFNEDCGLPPRKVSQEGGNQS